MVEISPPIATLKVVASAVADVPVAASPAAVVSLWPAVSAVAGADVLQQPANRDAAMAVVSTMLVNFFIQSPPEINSYLTNKRHSPSYGCAFASSLLGFIL